MDSSPAAFDAVGEQFIIYYDTLRGHVREQLTRQNLQPYINELIDDHRHDDGKVSAVDVGGGDGRDALWLAEQGIKVTLVDPSDMMLQKAAARLASMPHLEPYIELEAGNDKSVLQRYGARAFDLVISHGVLMYEVEAPQAQVDNLVKLTKPNGIISILTKGKYGAAMELTQEKRLSEIEALMSDGIFTNHLGESTRVYNAEQLMDMLQTSGARVLEWYGVRVASDSMRDSLAELSAESITRILAVERELGNNLETRGLGQMLHVIATRN